jgi:hypothetical protein
MTPARLHGITPEEAANIEGVLHASSYGEKYRSGWQRERPAWRQSRPFVQWKVSGGVRMDPPDTWAGYLTRPMSIPTTMSLGVKTAQGVGGVIELPPFRAPRRIVGGWMHG